MSRKSILLAATALVAVSLVVVLALFAGRDAKVKPPQTVSTTLSNGEAGKATPRPKVRKSSENAASRKFRSRPAKPVLEFDDDDEDERTPEEKRLAERIEKALDIEDFQLASDCAKEAMGCGNVEVRQAMVDTLGWFGERAIPELTPFLADPDEDVRDSAMNEWSMAVSAIENDAEKLGLVELAMNILTDEDALEDISGEYIGVDEKLAVESLVRLIEANGSKAGVDKAKETYEFVTGDEWQSKEAAAKWIAEEYEPSDSN